MSLIKASELKAVLRSDPKSVLIIDARQGPNAKLEYLSGHISGALWMDLEIDLASTHLPPANGGRHPLPFPQKFAATLHSFGVSKDRLIVIYDDKANGNAAARLWWMLIAMGYKNVQLLDGGLQSAIEEGLRLDSSEVLPIPIVSTPNTNFWELPTIEMQEVENILHSREHVIIDVRSPERYLGITEPIDLIAGHIPSAINIPFTSNLDAEGKFLPKEVLKEKYAEFFTKYSPQNIIVHCGSGVTACHTIFAMTLAGFDFPSLYVGSWSEWSRNGKPMVLLNTKDANS